MRRRFLLGLVALLAAAAPPLPATRAADEPVLVFAAASLKTALEAGGEAYRAETGTAVAFSFAASGALAKQLEQGAPADAFVSADLRWMDYAEKTGTVDPATRRVLAGNTLVLVAPADGGGTLDLVPGADLAGFLGDGRLAVGDPKSVPAGTYAVEALTSLGILAAVEARFAPVENVRAALALVAAGEAPAGIVFATDAAAEPDVRVVAAFPAGSHAPIVYPAAVTADSDRADAAAAFLDWLGGEAGLAVLAAQGFTAPAP